MKTINVEIVGDSPLLMNNPEQIMQKKTGTTNKLSQYDPKVEVVKAEYRNKKGKLFVPARCMFATIISGASFKKAGKFSAKRVLAGNIRIGEPELVLVPQKYDIDVQPVVIQRSRVMKARPRFDKWKLAFTLVYNDDFIADPNIIKDCLDSGGKIAGLLDWGPRNAGTYGTYSITKFEVAK